MFNYRELLQDNRAGGIFCNIAGNIGSLPYLLKADNSKHICLYGFLIRDCECTTKVN